MRLSEFRIKGFKSIVDQTISLGRVNCFIGANGVGKSNVLEALGVLSAAASGRVDDEAILRRGVRAGLPRSFKTSFASGQIPPHIFLEARGKCADQASDKNADAAGGAREDWPDSRYDATYRVSLLNPLERPDPAWSFKSEFLSEGDATLVSRTPKNKGKLNLHQTAGLAALKIVEMAPGAPASVLLRALQNYAIYSPNTPALRATVPDPQTRLPVGLAGGGLAEGFDALRRVLGEGPIEDAVDCLDGVLELIDWVVNVTATDATPRAKQSLRFTDRFMAPSRHTLTAYDASEGALYVLFAAVLCLSPSSPSIFAIDNLDSALNPRLVTRLVSRLAGWLQYADPDRQLLFTAHNPAVLDGLTLDDDDVRLFAVERNSEGHTTVRRIAFSSALKEQNKTFPLSRLWAMGNLGAVPNV
jgi:energy-coupling factor transporter ATP-binding protein EcfA2